MWQYQLLWLISWPMTNQLTSSCDIVYYCVSCIIYCVMCGQSHQLYLSYCVCVCVSLLCNGGPVCSSMALWPYLIPSNNVWPNQRPNNISLVVCNHIVCVQSSCVLWPSWPLGGGWPICSPSQPWLTQWLTSVHCVPLTGPSEMCDWLLHQ